MPTAFAPNGGSSARSARSLGIRKAARCRCRRGDRARRARRSVRRSRPAPGRPRPVGDPRHAARGARRLRRARRRSHRDGAAARGRLLRRPPRRAPPGRPTACGSRPATASSCATTPTASDPFLDDEDLGGLREVGGDAVYCRLGAHRKTLEGVAGFGFAVWAPNARRVSVVGDFNDWDGRRHPMRLRHDGGVWELFVPGLDAGARYKFEIKGADGGLLLQGRSGRLRGGAPAGDRLGAARRSPNSSGATRPGWRAAAPVIRARRRCRSTSAISAPGRASPARATAISPIASWPSG